MEETKKKRYAPLGGIEKVLASYRTGDITFTEIGERVGRSKTSVCNDLRFVFGSKAVDQAKNERRQAISKTKKLNDMNKGGAAKMSYSEAVACLKSEEIKRKGFLSNFETIVQLAQSVTGKPETIKFGWHSIREIEGKEGNIKIRYGEPKKISLEYKIDRYRFKITRGLAKNVNAIMFCVKAKGKISYYVFPPDKLAKIQSLNLKFDKHEKSKYADFLERVEIQK